MEKPAYPEYSEKSPRELLRLDPGEAGRFLDQLPLPERVGLILRASARERQELILLTSHPEELMAVFPPEELFFTIKEIGASDALPLISLTTPTQLHFILDIDWWAKDSLRPQKILAWLRVLFACSEDKVASWLHTVDFDLLVGLFKHFTAVFKVGEDEERLKEMDTLPPFTVDHHYFIQFKEPDAADILGRIVEIARDINPSLYSDLMESVIWDVKSECEEHAYKWRQARLADHGVPTFHAALDIYQPPSRLEIPKREGGPRLQMLEPGIQPAVPVPVYPLSVAERPPFFLKALELIGDPGIIDRVKREWAHVCNHVIMADVLDFDELKDIKRSIRKTARYLNVGLEYLSQGEAERAPDLLKTVPLPEIFRFGYAQAIALKKKANSLINKGYVQRDLSPADEPWRSILEGVLRRHPLYYDPLGADRGEREEDYRDFARLREVQETQERLEEAELIGKLIKNCFPDYPEFLRDLPLARCNIQLAADVTWGVMLFTAVAQKLLGNTFGPWPLKTKELHLLFPALWTKSGGKKAQKLSPDIKEELRKALIGPDFSPSSLESARINRYLDAWYERIEEEMGFLDSTTAVDSRYIHVLLVEP